MAESPPNLPGVVDGIAQQNFDALNKRLRAAEGKAGNGITVAGGRLYAEGSGSVKCPNGAAQSAVAEVAHGLGIEPRQIHIQLITVTGAGVTSYVWVSRVFEKNPTLFKFVYSAPTNMTSEVTIFYTWIAIG